jgi:hypothetical protein
VSHTAAAAMAPLYAWGVIAAKVLDVKSYVGRPRTKEEMLELDRREVEIISASLNQRPLCYNHDDDRRVGTILANRINPRTGAWEVKCEVDDATPEGQECIQKIRDGSMFGLSLKHRVQTSEPIEVSLCWKGARDDTYISKYMWAGDDTTNSDSYSPDGTNPAIIAASADASTRDDTSFVAFSSFTEEKEEKDGIITTPETVAASAATVWSDAASTDAMDGVEMTDGLADDGMERIDLDAVADEQAKKKATDAAAAEEKKKAAAAAAEEKKAADDEKKVDEEKQAPPPGDDLTVTFDIFDGKYASKEEAALAVSKLEKRAIALEKQAREADASREALVKAHALELEKLRRRSDFNALLGKDAAELVTPPDVKKPVRVETRADLDDVMAASAAKVEKLAQELAQLKAERANMDKWREATRGSTAKRRVQADDDEDEDMVAASSRRGGSSTPAQPTMEQLFKIGRPIQFKLGRQPPSDVIAASLKMAGSGGTIAPSDSLHPDQFVPGAGPNFDFRRVADMTPARLSVFNDADVNMQVASAKVSICDQLGRGTAAYKAWASEWEHQIAASRASVRALALDDTNARAVYGLAP